MPLRRGFAAVQNDLCSAPLLPFDLGHGMDPRVYATLRVAPPQDDEFRWLRPLSCRL
ncbi:hypothetical protein MPL1032_20055 [Mesorhizobium plurifarium]|uniref:Uncharacterized protein n=1 Tax=Mesorhizobium plurifarium TaxID=69974 RepID=A0A0K2VWL3_MESPL|nr:hypothetical protein MPL1032_20055 [Mesorhizobium plurifarium]